LETIPKINRAFDTRYEEAIARAPRPGTGQRDSGAGGPGAGPGCQGAGAAPAIPLLIGWKEILSWMKGDVSIKTLKRWTLKHGFPVSYVGRTPVADPHRIEAWKREVLGSESADEGAVSISGEGRVG
jgi:hypothetical protein